MYQPFLVSFRKQKSVSSLLFGDEIISFKRFSWWTNNQKWLRILKLIYQTLNILMPLNDKLGARSKIQVRSSQIYIFCLFSLLYLCVCLLLSDNYFCIKKVVLLKEKVAFVYTYFGKRYKTCKYKNAVGQSTEWFLLGTMSLSLLS